MKSDEGQLFEEGTITSGGELDVRKMYLIVSIFVQRVLLLPTGLHHWPRVVHSSTVQWPCQSSLSRCLTLRTWWPPVIHDMADTSRSRVSLEDACPWERYWSCIFMREILSFILMKEVLLYCHVSQWERYFLVSQWCRYCYVTEWEQYCHVSLISIT